MKSVLSVFGTRPEAIKMAPVVAELDRRNSEFVSRVCITAQHRDLLDQVLDVLPLRVDSDLNLMTAGQGVADIVVRGLPLLQSLLRKDRPDLVLVQGDTTTAFVAALAAFYERIPVGHVEAGLRTGDIGNPFPEEANRRFVDAVTDHFFAPTESAASNLLREGASPDRVVVSGNTVIDALLRIVAAQSEPRVSASFEARFRKLGGPDLAGRRLVLVTGHRRENFGLGLQAVCHALAALSRDNPEVAFVYAVHPNPNVRAPVEDILGSVPGVYLVPPLDYSTFAWALSRAHFVVTDSGGVQEEAPSLGVPVLVTRSTTERPEAVEAGAARLVGVNPEQIRSAAQQLLDDEQERVKMRIGRNPFGDGQAARRIVDYLVRA